MQKSKNSSHPNSTWDWKPLQLCEALPFNADGSSEPLRPLPTLQLLPPLPPPLWPDLSSLPLRYSTSHLIPPK
jgi:hypothetical protein